MIPKNILFLFFSLIVSSLGYIPVYVMLPLTTITSSLTIDDYDGLKSDFQKLASIGVKGVNVDCWWGLVESSPQTYSFDVYKQLVELAESTGLKMQIVMSFHRCGGNVGDSCDIELPSWVKTVANSHDIWYRDSQNQIDEEYVSLFVDEESIFPTASGSTRTLIQVYQDFFQAFKNAMGDLVGSVITEIQLGAGPAGELRYPSYQLDRWSYCGIGEFQSYNSYALAKVAAAATSIGHPEWGLAGGPNNAGTYNSLPYNTGFFSSSGNDNYRSSYGDFFLSWYTQELIDHGERIIIAAKNVFDDDVELSMKVAGIHWWYNDGSHAAELTAGYYNLYQGNDAYADIAEMFAKYDITFDFTCLEMLDSEQSSSCESSPQGLVAQTKQDAINAGINYSGENALIRYDSTAYNTILSEATKYGHDISSFTYLRLSDTLMQSTNFATFTSFVKSMASA